MTETEVYEHPLNKIAEQKLGEAPWWEYHLTPATAMVRMYSAQQKESPVDTEVMSRMQSIETPEEALMSVMEGLNGLVLTQENGNQGPMTQKELKEETLEEMSETLYGAMYDHALIHLSRTEEELMELMPGEVREYQPLSQTNLSLQKS
ncbi:MAG: hypothetical protein HN842_02320 [Gammaproteobacteria bacterium]|nr:hypothetical protein [Gammaproteobacteria bacterium]